MPLSKFTELHFIRPLVSRPNCVELSFFCAERGTPRRISCLKCGCVKCIHRPSPHEHYLFIRSYPNSPTTSWDVVVQSLSRVQLFATPWTAARQASLSVTVSWSLLKLMSIESVMPFKHLILCHPLLLLPSIFPSIRVFSSDSALCIRWPKYWSFSFSISMSPYCG